MIADTNPLAITSDITLEEIRQFDKYKSYTDEQINELIATIKTYTIFMYSVYSRQKKNGRIIALSTENQNLKAA